MNTHTLFIPPLLADKPELQAEVEATAPRHFFCPIGLYIMRDPVVLSSGQTCAWGLGFGADYPASGSDGL